MARTAAVAGFFGAALLALLVAGPAGACSASSRSHVSGPVLDIPRDGVICVALGPRPEQWVRISLSGGPRLDRSRLMAAAFAKRVDCVVAAGVGTCRIAGEDLALLVASPAITATAANWR